MIYPIVLKVNSGFLSELHHCEYGRYEDAELARKAGDTDLIKANGYELVACDFLDKFKTQIQIGNKEELCELYYALASGTIGLYHCQAANNLLDKIRPTVKEVNPELVLQWPHQSGL